MNHLLNLTINKFNEMSLPKIYFDIYAKLHQSQINYYDTYAKLYTPRVREVDSCDHNCER